MKTKLIIFFFLITPSLLYSQEYKKPLSVEDKKFSEYFLNKENIPIVRGKILNLPPEKIDSIKIRYFINTHLLESFQYNKSTIIKKDGTFELKLDNAFPMQNIYLYVQPFFSASIYANSDLYIELDYNKIKDDGTIDSFGDGVNYLGTDGEMNLYMNKFGKYRANFMNDFTKELNKIRFNNQLPYDEFKTKYDQVYQNMEISDNKFVNENPSQYSWIIEDKRLSGYYSIILIKHWYGKEIDNELWNRIKNYKCYLSTPDDIYFYYTLYIYINNMSDRNIKINWDDIKKYSAISDRARNLCDSMNYCEQIIKKKVPYDTAYFKLIRSRTLSILSDTLWVVYGLQTIKYLDSIFPIPKADFLKLKIFSNNTNTQKMLLETIRNNMNTEWCIDILNIENNKILGKVDSINKILKTSKSIEPRKSILGQATILPFGAKLYNSVNIQGSRLLANLKTEFKDKAILIDFWATWCSPCLNEMPYSKKLQEQTEDLPIAYVYLCTSTGSNIEAWKSKIAELRMPGIHLFVDENIENELMSLFSKSGFPSYVFIDSEGNFRPGAIERPSLTDRNKIVDLLKKKNK